MKHCDGCRFCCWSFAVHDVPHEVKGIETKPALSRCPQECKTGCYIHQDKNYPPMCKEFLCPYLNGEPIYRPDKFQKVLEQSGGTVGNYIPTISLNVPIEQTDILVRQTRSIPASIRIGENWIKVVISLDRKSDGSWSPTKEATEKWEQFYSDHGEKLDPSTKETVGVKMI